MSSTIYIYILDTYGGSVAFLSQLRARPAEKLISAGPLFFTAKCTRPIHMTRILYTTLWFLIEQAIQLRPLVMVIQLYTQAFQLPSIASFLSSTGITVFETISVLSVGFACSSFNKLIFKMVRERYFFVNDVRRPYALL